jgi:hypothetical protein
VIVGDLDFMGITAGAHETEPPLIVDPDRMLPCAIASQRFETVASSPGEA